MTIKTQYGIVLKNVVVKFNMKQSVLPNQNIVKNHTYQLFVSILQLVYKIGKTSYSENGQERQIGFLNKMPTPMLSILPTV